MVFDALREKSMNVPVGGVLETEHGLREGENVSKREKVGVGPGLGECKAEYEKNSCIELRVRWRGLYA